uniref:Ig-like domain-containing protein n=1 Tax=Macrostomum lignano TaxID=282301 RepID=A0A1I8JBV4_9PLAT
MGQSAAMACLILLLGFLLSAQLGVEAQLLNINDPFFSEVSVVTVKRHQAQAGRMVLRCNVSPPGRFKGWVKDSFVIGNDPSLTLSGSDPNKYGTYLCIADPAISPNLYRAMKFVITEMPPDDRTTEVAAALNRDVSLTCMLRSGSGSIKWYKYNDQNFKFDEIPGQTGRQLVLKLLRAQPGARQRLHILQAFKVVKDPVQQMIDGRMTNVYEHSMRGLPTDVASVPISVTPKSKVAFECHKVTPSDSTQWYFRDNTTTSPSQYSDLSGQGGVEIQENPDSSVLSVKNCDVKNKGYYRCMVGGTVKYAFLDIRVIVPTIHEYGKAIYDLARNPGADNELECEIPIGGELKDVIWRVVPSDGSPSFDISVNRESGGFETSIKDSGSSQLVTIKFRDNPRFNNYRLECRLGDELDYVTLRSAQPMQISITVDKYYKIDNFAEVNCTHDTRLGDIKFHINDKKTDPIGPPKSPHRVLTGMKTIYQSYDQPNKWYRCSGVDPSTGIRKYSDPVPLVSDPRTVMSYRAVSVGRGTFRFVFDNPTASNSGSYFCIHDVSNTNQRVKSSEVNINWCETSQFMCDNRCRDRSIVCNGVTECADRSDEHPALCSPCEPNEVPCQDWKGVRPARNCVLKHWLCDGTDDCENGYDEESPLSKKWCTNTCINKPWLNCPHNSTCCNSNDKCIVRAYECDAENDCATSEDENACCSLALTEPTSRRLVEQREGSRVTLTCRAVGNERPTINWRCNWGKLRDETRMKESNRVVRRNPDNTYEVEGTLVIENFTRADECLYNCEAVTKCKRQLSPIFDVKVGTGVDCNKTCGIGGVCQNNVCNCKANVEGPNCDRCKRGYHSLRKDHPDGCVPCFCSDRSNACENAGLFFEEKQVTPIDASSVRLMGWGLYGVYEESTSHEKLTVESGPEISIAPTGDSSGALRTTMTHTFFSLACQESV